jgi:hypothetical protein
MKKSSKSQEVQRITVKSPLIPLFQRGKLVSPPFGKGRLGGILEWLTNYKNFIFKSYILFIFLF